ncbi:transmembrane protease serine 9-like [Drosophila gunungcola]|uniref:transmembrane protease serine 9-like n=1 Tax=Drosophila gunungcola TaxID=103775 RepID=UPI0022E00903|nr:transmembrane protease serine 9-like [Drosophila gunungcola]
MGASSAMRSHFALIPLFALFLGHQGASQFLEYPCGSPIGSRISGGSNANFENSIYMAAIFNQSNHFQCGGTVINKLFILTAAHCLDTKQRLYVNLGAYYKYTPKRQYDVSYGLQHRDYNKFSGQNDIGLLKLANSVDYNRQIQPMCIYLNKEIKKQLASVQTFEAFGWGRKRDGLESDILQTITLNQLNQQYCKSELGESLNSTQICAGVSNGDTCEGDSGGPLAQKVKLINNTILVVQFGIISYGKKTCDSVGVYTDVTSYVDWIQETISKYKDMLPAKSTPIPPVPQNYQQVNRPVAPEVWINSVCGGDGNSMTSIIRPTIYGPDFKAQGVLIADRFVLTVAADMPENAASLEVSVMGTTKYAEYGVSSVFKNKEYSDEIFLLELMQPVISNGQNKSICIVSETYQKDVENNKAWAIFDNVNLKEFRVDPFSPQLCSYYIGSVLEPNQLCVENPSGISHIPENSGNVLVNKITVNKKPFLVLIGIVSYSSDGMQVITNVMRYTRWIAGIINQFN